MENQKICIMNVFESQIDDSKKGWEFIKRSNSEDNKNSDNKSEEMENKDE